MLCRSRLFASVGLHEPFRLGRRSVFIVCSFLVASFGPASTCNSAPLCQFLAHFRVSRCRSSSQGFTLATAVFGLLLRFLGLSSPSACSHRLSLPLLSLASKSLRRSFPARTLPIGPCALSFRSLGLALPEARFRICHCTNCTSVVPGICAYFASAVSSFRPCHLPFRLYPRPFGSCLSACSPIDHCRLPFASSPQLQLPLCLSFALVPCL